MYLENDDDAFDDYRLRCDEKIEHLIKSSRAKIVAFKPIADSQHARVILERFPRSRALWIYRRFDDVVNSALRNFTEHRKYLYYMLHEPDVATWRLENVNDNTLGVIRDFYDAGISDASAAALIWWLRNQHFFAQDLASEDDALIVNYEDMVLKPDATYSAIFRFIGLDFDKVYARMVVDSSVEKHPVQPINSEIRNMCEDTQNKLDLLKRNQISGRK